MRWLKAIVRELFGLFVEDGSFALALLAWVVLAALVFPLAAPKEHWTGPALFAGLALILMESVLRFARKR